MAAMTLAMAAFAANDALVKAFASDLPVAQTIAVRGVFASALVLVFMLVVPAARDFRGVFDPLVTARSLAECLAIFCLIAALTRLPIGDVTALSQSVPLVLLPLAALVLRERVTPANWLLVGLGFIGILLVAKPGGATFDPAYLLLAVTAVCFALRDLSARHVGQRFAAAPVTLSTVAVVALVAGLVVLAKGPVAMTGAHFSGLALAALLLAVGQAAVITAFRLASVADAGPFNYTKTAFAVMIGVIFFGERPDALTLIGMAFVVAAGLVIALRAGRR